MSPVTVRQALAAGTCCCKVVTTAPETDRQALVAECSVHLRHPIPPTRTSTSSASSRGPTTQIRTNSNNARYTLLRMHSSSSTHTSNSSRRRLRLTDLPRRTTVQSSSPAAAAAVDRCTVAGRLRIITCTESSFNAILPLGLTGWHQNMVGKTDHYRLLLFPRTCGSTATVQCSKCSRCGTAVVLASSSTTSSTSSSTTPRQVA